VVKGAFRGVTQCHTVPHPNTLEYLYVRCSLVVKKVGHEADHSPQFGAGDKESMELTSMHFYVMVTI